MKPSVLTPMYIMSVVIAYQIPTHSIYVIWFVSRNTFLFSMINKQRTGIINCELWPCSRGLCTLNDLDMHQSHPAITLYVYALCTACIWQQIYMFQLCIDVANEPKRIHKIFRRAHSSPRSTTIHVLLNNIIVNESQLYCWHQRCLWIGIVLFLVLHCTIALVE